MPTDNDAAILYPLDRLAEDLDGCSPELRLLIRMALNDDRGYARVCGERDQKMAALRLLEVLTTRTREAFASRAA